jgi:hypothetical protein
MKRSTRAAVSIIAATITFASLMVFAKPMNGFRHRDKSNFGFSHHHDCNGVRDEKKQEQGRNKWNEPIGTDSVGAAR